MSHRKSAPSASGVLPVPPAGEGQIKPQKPAPISHHSAETLSINLYESCRGQFTGEVQPRRWSASQQLYTPEERRRRDASPWTTVQAALAPIQFFVFLVSLCLVIRYLASGEGQTLALASVVVKTITLYAIMITGSIWEREVFGRYLFARPFFWEDVFSILVLALHSIYLVALPFNFLSPQNLMLVALAAYAAYVINATQFLLKLRAARREQTIPVGAMGIAS